MEDRNFLEIVRRKKEETKTAFLSRMQKYLFFIGLFFSFMFFVSGYISETGEEILFFYRLSLYYSQSFFLFSIFLVLYAFHDRKKNSVKILKNIIFDIVRVFILLLVSLLEIVVKMISFGELI